MKLNPYLAIIFAATIGGSSGVFIKLLHLPSTSLTFFRVFIPVMILLAYLSWKKVKLFQGNYKIMLVASGLNAGRIFLFFVAYLYTSIGNAVILLFTWPIFATIFGAIYLKEKVSKRTSLLIALAFIGIILMYSNKELSFGSKDFIGMGAMLLSAIIFSLTMTIFKKELKNYKKTETIFYQNLIGAIIFLPFIFINKPLPTITQTSVGVIYAFLMGIVVYLLFFFALKKLKMSHYSLFTYWEVPAALIFSVIFFKEVITSNMIAGGALIILAGLLLIKKKPAVPTDVD
ncbi:EamA family transporter [Candidatus Woesearchaeota archaeon]|nr:EamA family transporter [Candidatus Woesearchaeota archaeon]